MMKIAQFAALIVVSLTMSVGAKASDPIGIYAVIDRVVFEPNEESPERVQVWGTFALAKDRGSVYDTPVKGYLYYTCDASKTAVCRREWADLKRVAGSGQCVGFGGRYQAKGRVRHEKEEVGSPDIYPIQNGVVKVTPEQSMCAKLKEVAAMNRAKPRAPQR
jgi:hypothetical protein